MVIPHRHREIRDLPSVPFKLWRLGQNFFFVFAHSLHVTQVLSASVKIVYPRVSVGKELEKDRFGQKPKACYTLLPVLLVVLYHCCTPLYSLLFSPFFLQK